MNDERGDLDDLLGELTDLTPSPGFRAELMRRLDAAPVRRDWRWRMAFAGVATILVAAVVWFAAGRPGPQPTTSHASSRDVALSAPPPGPRTVGPELVEGRTPQVAAHTAPVPGHTAPRHGASPHARVAAGLRPTATVPLAAATEQTDTQRNALPEIVLAPLPGPQPLDAPPPIALDPLVLEEDEIPLLEVGPVQPPERQGVRH